MADDSEEVDSPGPSPREGGSFSAPDEIRLLIMDGLKIALSRCVCLTYNARVSY